MSRILLITLSYQTITETYNIYYSFSSMKC